MPLSGRCELIAFWVVFGLLMNAGALGDLLIPPISVHARPRILLRHSSPAAGRGPQHGLDRQPAGCDPSLADR